jgi:hypothetical protein
MSEDRDQGTPIYDELAQELGSNPCCVTINTTDTKGTVTEEEAEDERK